MEHFLKLLPKLSTQMRKGDCGKIGIIGGSVEYTGAPYFSAATVSRLGADLIHVFCAPDAAPIIKGYSPDLIVHPGMQHEIILPKLERIDALVLGPGLGRSKDLWPLITSLYEYVKSTGKPFVMDGDALWFLQEDLKAFPKLDSAILTPNCIEFSRLCHKALGVENVHIEHWKNREKVRELAIALSKKLQVAIFLKGETDEVITTNGEMSICSTQGSLRRCGGQGDVTAGALALLLFWARKKDLDWTTAFHEAGIANSWIVRTAGRRAFERLGRSMVTPALIEELTNVILSVETREVIDTVHSSM